MSSQEEDQTNAYFAESYAAAKQTQEPVVLGLALLNLGELARKRGDLERATTYLEEALTTVRTIDMTWGIANILTLLGRLAIQQQHYERAKQRYRESLPIYQKLGNAPYTAWCLEGVAVLACAQGDYKSTTRLCASAAAFRLQANTPLPPTEQDDLDRVLMTARAELDEKVFGEEWGIGSSITQEEAISCALTGPLVATAKQ